VTEKLEEKRRRISDRKTTVEENYIGIEGGSVRRKLNKNCRRTETGSVAKIYVFEKKGDK